LTVLNVNVIVICVPKVFEYGCYHVYIYGERGTPHKSKHCHVVEGRAGKGKQAATVLLLPSLRRIVGPDLPGNVLEYIRERLDEILDAWDKYNPNDKSERE
jgi:hypothetical protein